MVRDGGGSIRGMPTLLECLASVDPVEGTVVVLEDSEGNRQTVTFGKRVPVPDDLDEQWQVRLDRD